MYCLNIYNIIHRYVLSRQLYEWVSNIRQWTIIWKHFTAVSVRRRNHRFWCLLLLSYKRNGILACSRSIMSITIHHCPKLRMEFCCKDLLLPLFPLRRKSSERKKQRVNKFALMRTSRSKNFLYLLGKIFHLYLCVWDTIWCFEKFMKTSKP